MGHEGEGHVPVTASHSQCQRGVETVGELTLVTLWYSRCCVLLSSHTNID